MVLVSGAMKVLRGWLPAHSELFANRMRLIANDMHSREKPNCCKQSTYEILIANEFRLQNGTPKRVKCGAQRFGEEER